MCAMPTVLSPISNRTLVKLPVGASSKGNACLPFDMRLRGGESLTFDASYLIDRFESLYIDATQSSSSFQITFSDTARSIVIAPASESCNRTFSAGAVFSVTNLDPTNPAIISGIGFACSMPVYERFPGTGILRPGGVRQAPGQFTQIQGTFVPQLGSTDQTFYANPGPWVPPSGAIWDLTMQTPNPPGPAAFNSVTVTQDGLSAYLNTNNENLLIRSNSYVNGGKRYFEIDMPGGNIFGITAASLRTTYDYLNDPRYSSAILKGSFFIIPGNQGIEVSLAGGTSRYGCAVDLDGRLIWFRNGAGAWNADANANPTTGVGGLSLANVVYPVTICAVAGGDSLTFFLYSGKFAPLNPPPAGFTYGWPMLTDF